MGGGDQVTSLKQFVQFGIDKQMAVGGTLFELESIRAVPDEARIGWWTMEWWWDQPGVPHVAEFVAAIKKVTGGRRHRAQLVRLCRGADAARWSPTRKRRSTRRSWRMRWQASSCRRRSRCSRATPDYRAGDHELMSTVFVGEAHPPQGDPDNMFTVKSRCPAKRQPAGAETGCKMQWPA